eukprot:ANDGO_04543.mRNA.1 FK506-binding protein 59
MTEGSGTNVIERVELTADGGVVKEIFVRGTGTAPKAGQQVTTHYTGRLLDGTVFDSSVERNSPFDFTLGKGQVIKAWDLCVASMLIGEKCRVTATAPYAYGASGSPPKIPANATLVFDLELLGAEDKEPNSWELTDDQKHELCVKRRTEGNDFFAKGEFQRAVESYKKAVGYWGEFSGAAADGDKLPCYLNASQSHLKLKQWKDAEREASSALKIDGANIKGLYRRAQAWLGLHEYEKARLDAAKWMELEPHNDAAQKFVESVNAIERDAEKKEKQVFAKMFA